MSPTTLKLLLLQAIDAICKVGLIVRAVVSDQGSNNRAMYRQLGISATNPYLVYNGQKIVFFYDSPHLMKNIRNNLNKGDFQCQNDVMSWKFIEDFYKIDSSLPIRLAPKLSEKHVNPPPFKTMSVKLATQVLSHSVASGISLLCSLGQLPKEAMPTAVLCETMDKLFNVFNSYSLFNANKFKRAFSGKMSDHHCTFLRSTYQFLSSLETKRSLPCIEGWKHNITSLLQLWGSMVDPKAVLCTSRLNQDCLENLFSLIRGHGRHRDNPDSVQFIAAYRAVSVDFLFIKSDGSNCQNDMDNFVIKLKNLTDVISKEKAPSKVNPLPSYDDCVDDDLRQISHSPPTFSSAEDCILVYLAGYIVKKVAKKFSCSSCTAILTEQNKPIASAFLISKSYDDTSSLTSPGDCVVEMVSHFEAVFRNCVPTFHMNYIMQTFIRQVDLTDQSFKCGCPNHAASVKTYMVKLFFIVRIHHYLRMQNRDLSMPNGKRNRKMMKLTHV